MPGETTRKEASTATDIKTIAPQTRVSVSIKSHQSSMLVVRSTYTEPTRDMSSMARSDHQMSQSEHVTPASQSEIIQPSKASVESKRIFSFTQTTPVEKATTKEPTDTTEKPDVQAGGDSPPPG